MIKCPRCQIEQENTDTCQYCDYDMENHSPPSLPGNSHRKTLGIAILCVFIAITTGIHFFQKQKAVESTPDLTAISQISNELNIPGLENIIGDIASGGGFSSGSIISALIFSIIGMGYFGYGKKNHRNIILFTGVALMCYPYFVYDTLMIIAVGMELCFMPLVMTMILE